MINLSKIKRLNEYKQLDMKPNDLKRVQGWFIVIL